MMNRPVRDWADLIADALYDIEDHIKDLERLAAAMSILSIPAEYSINEATYGMKLAAASIKEAVKNKISGDLRTAQDNVGSVLKTMLNAIGDD